MSTGFIAMLVSVYVHFDVIHNEMMSSFQGAKICTQENNKFSTPPGASLLTWFNSDQGMDCKAHPWFYADVITH